MHGKSIRVIIIIGPLIFLDFNEDAKVFFGGYFFSSDGETSLSLHIGRTFYLMSSTY